MKRSAAPSFNIKRARFLPQIMKTIPLLDKENVSESVNELSDIRTDTVNRDKRIPEEIRSNEEVLDIIFEADSTVSETGNSNENVSSSEEKLALISTEKNLQSPVNMKSFKMNRSVLLQNTTKDDVNERMTNCIFCVKDREEAALFNVVWCKRSGKKHKTWEGDGLLIVRNRLAVLKDLDGKILDKGVGYKLKETESLEEGSKFFIGGKECEIQCRISNEECQSGKYCKCNSITNVNTQSLVKQPAKQLAPVPAFSHKSFKKFCPPMPVNLNCSVINKIDGPGEDPFILPAPSPEQEAMYNKTGKPVVDVYVDSFLTKQLRTHQKEGISFMYKCIMGFQHEFGQGVILADEMGLGKTLQCIALIWTLYKRGPYGGLPILRNVIIITPSSLVTNWQNEFHKWLGKTRLAIFAVNQKNTVKDFVKNQKPVLIISYEMFLRSSELLSSVPFDLVICDEGHRIKNLNIKISNVILLESGFEIGGGGPRPPKHQTDQQHGNFSGPPNQDEMGLGKTLQCIALIWTLYKRGPYGGLPILRNVIIITPSSLVTNWQNEFHKWLGKTRLAIFAVNQKNTVKDFVKNQKPVLIISYEMFLRSSELLSSVPFDLVICDEGHRIKNLNIKISNVINCLSTTRRILLTGTPIQNDLAEFFSIVDFVNPGVLGTLQYFRKTFERPIIESRNQECSESEKEYGEEKSEELGNMTKMFMLRRTQEVINQYLPPKTETVIFCRPSELQINLYNSLLRSREFVDIFSSATFDTSTPLVCISLLRKLCNHPSLLHKVEPNEDLTSNAISSIDSTFPPKYQASPKDSGKMKVLENMLSSLFSSKQAKEKVVIVSAFTKMLDILENFCRLKQYDFLRLDGSTYTTSRQGIVDIFNYSYTKYNVFLLSSKAGGVGFNLIGASRIILYDIDWNPANDLQAMSRIWRDGQKHDVYVYRLLTTGTIEEKIYQRQLSKQCLSGSVLNCNSSGKLRFSREELMDLFTFHENTRCITHDLINCKCLSLEFILNIDESEEADASEEKNVGMAELMNWNHICGPISSDNCSDFCLVNGGSDITFLFQNVVNSRQKL